MALGFTLKGLEQLRAELKALPPDLQAEARTEIVRTTEATANQLRAVYPEVTGKLRKGVKTSVRELKRRGTVGTVKSTAPHAHLWEFGTVDRQTEKGWKRGRMPSNYTRGLYAIAARQQRPLDLALLAIVRHGGDFRVAA